MSRTSGRGRRIPGSSQMMRSHGKNTDDDDALLTCYVAERDLDLLLAEELQSSESFRNWLQAKLLIDRPGQRGIIIQDVALQGSPTVQHSVSRDEGLGETDLEAI